MTMWSDEQRAAREAAVIDGLERRRAVAEAAAGRYGWRLAGGISPEEAVERFAAVAPDGVRFLGLGKIGAVDKDQARRSVAAILQILLGFSAPDWDVIADLEAGPTTPFERY